MGNLGEFTDGGIDPTQHEPGQDFSPLPPGWYPAEIEAAEIKDTKAEDGKYLKVTLSIIGEAYNGRNYNGRKVFPTLNILNPSSQAQEIGRRELADLARACEIAMLDDEDKLLGKQLEVRLTVKQDKGYEPDNKVKGYRRLGAGNDSPAVAPPAGTKPAATKQKTAKPVATSSPAAKKGKMPWEK